MRRFSIALALFVSAALMSLAPANRAEASARGIKDNGNFFSDDTERRANATIDNIFNKYKAKEVLIETFEALPSGTTLDALATQRVSDSKLNGLYVLIVRKGGQVRILAGTHLQAIFTEARIRELRTMLTNDLQNKENWNAALLNAVDQIAQDFDRGAVAANAPPAAGGGRSSPPPPSGSASTPPAKSGGGPLSFLPSGIMGWVCMGLGIWIVIALIRSVMARRSSAANYGGGPGYGQGGPGYGGQQGYGGGGYGGPGYGGGGGGGGWGTSIMGGLFGAVAGNYIYDKFTGSGSSHAQQMPPSDTGGGGGGAAAGGAAGDPGWAQPDTDYSSGGQSSSSGQDFGSGGGSGQDFGGGGQDFGGGGQDFGGDFGGGGGGDFGGGGGGDFGGGGGGDFGGGGGGDFGGGGE